MTGSVKIPLVKHGNGRLCCAPDVPGIEKQGKDISVKNLTPFFEQGG
ncbi:MAG: hypothetical protein NUV31_05665 [Dehalococcoidales bacterium]|jgi:hypothetical protein|nr:hypothetical protein [Dehalococcoidales bacterium]